MTSTIQHNIHHVLVALVSCGTDDVSCHDNKDHHDKHGHSDDHQDWQQHKQESQEWQTGGQLGIAPWVVEDFPPCVNKELK